MHRSIALLTLTGLLLSGTGQAQTPASGDDSLYRAWGRKTGIRTVMEDFFTRLLADPRTAPFFKQAKRESVVTQLTDQLCQQAGGPCQYEGSAMGPVHEAFEIHRRDFNALVEVLQQSMSAHGIPFEAQNRMLARHRTDASGDHQRRLTIAGPLAAAPPMKKEPLRAPL